MEKLIDADVFDSILRDAQAECKKNGGNFRFGVLNSVRANLANQPAVDAVPVVHGRWIYHDDDIMPWVSCSECDVCTDSTNKTPYCPYCGAKMDGERREEDAAD